MGNWIPNDPTSLVAQILKISAAFTPPPPEGFISPMTWGIESNVIERFASAGVSAEKISFVRDTLLFNAPVAPAEVVGVWKKYYGPMMSAFEAAERMVGPMSCREGWKRCSSTTTRARARTSPPLQRPFCDVTVAL